MEIPYIELEEEQQYKKKQLLTGVIITITLSLGVLVLIHTLFMPLGDVLLKIVSRLGV